MGEALRLGFERRLKLEFHGSKVLGTPYLIPPSFRLGAALLRLKRAFQSPLQSPTCQQFSKVSPELRTTLKPGSLGWRGGQAFYRLWFREQASSPSPRRHLSGQLPLTVLRA